MTDGDVPARTPTRGRESSAAPTGPPVSQPEARSGPLATDGQPDLIRPGRAGAAGRAREIVQTLALTLIIFFVVQTFVAQPFQVEQESMRRTLEPGDYVLVDRLTPRWDAYDRGDVVVFVPPDTWGARDDTPYIKRVVAVAGDEVEIRDGRLYVNRVPLDEPYVFEVDGRAQPTTTDTEPPRWTVPDGQVFVVGDHRSRSEDSRVFGPVPASSIVGRAWLRYWPLHAFGILETPTYRELTGRLP